MAKGRNSKNTPKPNGNGVDHEDVETDSAEMETEAAGSSADRGIGDNSGTKQELTDEQRQVLTYQHRRRYEAALEAKKRADAELKNVAKLAKAELGPNAVHDIKLLIELSSPEGEDAAKARMEAQARVMRWLGLSVGHQGDLFPVDLTPAVDKARADGKRAGLAGEQCACPHAPSVPQHAAWIEGWHDGQAVLVATKMRPLPVQDEAPADDEPETVDEAQQRVRQDAAIDSARAGMAATYRDDGLDIPANLRRN